MWLSNIVRSSVLLVAAFLAHHAAGQCPNDNASQGSAVTVPCPGSISGGCINRSNYATVNVVTGRVYTFSTCGANWDTHITLYNGGAASNLAFNDDGCNGSRSTVQWTASYTGTVRVLVDRSNCNNTGSFSCAPLWVTCGLNDDRCTATTLSVSATCSNTVGTNEGATATSGVSSPSCSTYSGGDVWFKFVAPSTGNVVISTSTVGGSSLTNGGMALYSAASNCSSTFTELVCANNSPYGGNMPYITRTGLTSGTTYYIRFWENGNNAFGDFNICVYDPTPTNDDPCNAITLIAGATCTNTAGTNLFTTATAGIPAPTCSNYAGGDVWFKFTGPASGQMTVTASTFGSSPLTDGGMSIYTATACAGTYTEIACTDDAPSGGLMPSLVLSGLTNGATYYVRFWEYGNNAFGEFNICAVTPAAPANDNPCGATVLTVGSSCTNTTGTTGGATNTAGIPTPTCGNYLGGDVWFRAVAPASGRLTITTSTVGGSSLTDAAMAVYDAASCGAAMTQVSCNDDVGASTMPALSFTGLTSGASYYIRVWAKGNTTYGQFNICAFEPIANDEPCSAIALIVGTSCTMVSRTNVSATNTGAVPSPGCGAFSASSRDVWYSFVAPASGVAVIESTAGTLTDGAMALYSASSCSGSMALLDCSDDEGTGYMPFLRYADLVPGSTYYLRFWGYGSASGTFNLCVWSPAMPIGKTCVYFLELFDSGENGWGTSAVQVQINGGAIVNYTVTGYYSNAMIGLNSGDLFQVSYVNSGPNQNQNRYQIRQVPGGFGVFTAGPSPTNGVSFFEVADCTPPDPPREDCRGGTSICGSQTVNDNPAGTGFDRDLRYTTFGCLSSAERQGTWFKFLISGSGKLGLTIAPSNSGDDYDFAVWGPESSVICPPGQQPVRCSYSGNTGNTGLRTTSFDASEDDTGDKWVAALDVVVGEIYVMYISNYSQSGLSFGLSWQLTNGAALDCLLLPVDFIGLDAELHGDVIEVQWSTASESNSSHYVVERSADALEYVPIGTVRAMGHTTTLTAYTFVDDAPLEGLNYYRVVQVDVDGSTMTSPADYAVYRKTTTGMVVFPNPAGDILWASFEMPEDDAVIWRIVDANGRLLEQDLYQGSKGNMLIDVPLDRLAAGTYTLLVNDSRGRMSRSAHFVKY